MRCPARNACGSRWRHVIGRQKRKRFKGVQACGATACVLSVLFSLRPFLKRKLFTISLHAGMYVNASQIVRLFFAFAASFSCKTRKKTVLLFFGAIVFHMTRQVRWRAAATLLTFTNSIQGSKKKKLECSSDRAVGLLPVTIAGTLLQLESVDMMLTPTSYTLCSPFLSPHLCLSFLAIIPCYPTQKEIGRSTQKPFC